MPPDDHPGVARVKEMWERGEFDKLEKIIRLWDSFQVMGRAANFARNVVIWLGGMLAAWFIFWEYIAKAIKLHGGQ